VWTSDGSAVVARARVGPAGWPAGVDELLERIACRFGRIERRRRVRGFLLGLLTDLPRKNCWTLAEHAGDATPDGMQHLLARAVWNPDGECARTCATTWWTTWAIAARCW
jgi:hypothetical protein